MFFFHGFPDPAITLGTSGANKGGGADGAGLGRGATGALYFDGYDDDGGGAYIVLRKPKGMVGSGERERRSRRLGYKLEWDHLVSHQFTCITHTTHINMKVRLHGYITLFIV